MAKKVTRLFTSFEPQSYELRIEPNKNSMTFRGSVKIKGKKVGRPSQRLTFHQKQLKITSASVVCHDRKSDRVIEVERTNNQNTLYEFRIHSRETLYPGSYTIELKFEGKITDDMQGIYVSNFQHEGVNKQLVATQLESHHARELFPCIDEPEAKATFQLTLVTEPDISVLSNTPILKQVKESDLQVTLFEPTPRMPTYLLAFVYGEMHFVESKTKQGVVVRSWSTVAQQKQTLQYSVDEAVKCLEFFTEYFGVDYPLPKCDQVALPDFDAGAMENWGLITYREVALLTDAQNRSISNEQYISMVIAHELSHQWFGNLVTMKWWDDLWLNESFASLMEHIALDEIHPDWQQWEHYVASDVISTTSRDIYSDIQPVGVDVTDPDLIESLFDPGIVYAKGGRLLKMLRDYIGEEAFRKGLVSYFKEHAYSNASRTDLWTRLSESSGKNVSDLMAIWIRQPGMPVVTVDQEGTVLKINQKRLLLDRDDDESIWPIPLLADQTLKPDLIETRTANISASSPEFVTLNQHASGHYFVRYDNPKHRKFLNKQIQNLKLLVEARINILNDAYVLSRKGISPLTEAFDTVLGCVSEDRDSVWAAISRILSAGSQLTEGNDSAESQIKKLRIQLATNLYNKLDWDEKPNDDPNTKQVRHTALAYMAIGEDAGVIKEAIRRFETCPDLSTLPAEIRSTILSVAVKHGNSSVIDRLLGEYANATADLQLDITAALSATKQPKVAEKVFAKALGPRGFVRTQDLMRWIAVFLRNHYIRDFTWDWLTTNWQWVEQSLGQSKSFDYLPVYCASNFTTSEWKAKYLEFFEPLTSDKRLQRNIAVGRADIEARIAWRKRDETPITKWLAKNIN